MKISLKKKKHVIEYTNETSVFKMYANSRKNHVKFQKH